MFRMFERRRVRKSVERLSSMSIIFYVAHPYSIVPGLVLYSTPTFLFSFVASQLLLKIEPYCIMI